MKKRLKKKIIILGLVILAIGVLALLYFFVWNAGEKEDEHKCPECSWDDGCTINCEPPYSEPLSEMDKYCYDSDWIEENCPKISFVW